MIASLLAGAALLVIAFMWTMISTDSGLARGVLTILGFAFVITAVAIHFRTTRQDTAHTGDAADAVRKYYQALDRHNDQGYQEAWILLSDAKRKDFEDRYGWKNAKQFAGGFETTVGHNAIYTKELSSTGEDVELQVVILFSDKLPQWSGQRLLRTMAIHDIAMNNFLQNLVTGIMPDLTLHYVGVDEKRDEIMQDIENHNLPALLHPELLDEIASKHELKRKTGTSLPTIHGSPPVELVSRVQVHDRRVVKEAGTWRLDRVTIQAEGLFQN
jgi:hypothetical protein